MTSYQDWKGAQLSEGIIILTFSDNSSIVKTVLSDMRDRFEVIDAKSEAGWRTVPIHPHIADLVNTLKSSTNGEYLFPELTLNKVLSDKA